MKPGIYQSTELSNEAYHSGPGVSQSQLKLIDRSPAHLRASLDGLTKNSQTPGMFIGTAIHAAALEPEEFDKQYVIAPEEFADRRAKGYKAWTQEQDPRQTILMASEYVRIQGMRDALHRHPWVGPRLSGAQCEVSCFANDPVTGELCRVRFDMVAEDGMILDLKKTTDARDGAISKAIGNYGYYIQNAYYLDVPSWLGDDYRPAGFAFVFIEDEPPYGIAVRFLDPEDLERGRNEYRRLLNRYHECRVNDHWPSYDAEPSIISLPGYARYQIDNQE